MNEQVHNNQEMSQSQVQGPKASVVVCVYNRPGQVKDCIKSLLNQTFRPFEIVIVDDGSTDETPRVLNDLQHANSTDVPIRIVTHPRNLGLCRARNTGLDAASGDIVLYTDSDCTVHPDWLAALVAPLDNSEYVGASGLVIDDPPRNWAEWAAAGMTRLTNHKLQGRLLVGNNMAFQRSALLTHRWDQRIRCYADEDDLAVRMSQSGCNFAFAPDAIVYHHHPYTIRSYLRNAWRQGQGSAYFWWKHRKFIGRDVVFLLLGLISLPLILWHRHLVLLPTAFLLLHLAAHLYNERFFKGKSWPVSLWVLPLVLAHSVVKLASVLSWYLTCQWKARIS